MSGLDQRHMPRRDPGPAGAGAVPVHPAPGAPGLSSGASSESGEEAVTELENLERREMYILGRDKPDVVVGNWKQNFFKCGGSENSGKT